MNLFGHRVEVHHAAEAGIENQKYVRAMRADQRDILAQIGQGNASAAAARLRRR